MILLLMLDINVEADSKSKQKWIWNLKEVIMKMKIKQGRSKSSKIFNEIHRCYPRRSTLRVPWVNLNYFSKTFQFEIVQKGSLKYTGFLNSIELFFRISSVSVKFLVLRIAVFIDSCMRRQSRWCSGRRGLYFWTQERSHTPRIQLSMEEGWACSATARDS